MSPGRGICRVIGDLLRAGGSPQPCLEPAFDKREGVSTKRKGA